MSCKKQILNSNSCTKVKENQSKESNISDLIQCYINKYINCYDNEDKWWGDRNISWNEALKRAWSSRFKNGKIHSHQNRVSKKLDQGLKVTLNDKKQPEDFKNFDEIYTWILSVTNSVVGLGETTAYDVARRLGVWLNLKPTSVYLHAGAAEGAKHLGIKEKIVELNKFPQELQKLDATHAENFLCIYQEKLKGLNLK